MIHVSFGNHDSLNKNAKFLPPVKPKKNTRIKCNRGRQFFLQIILIDSKVYNGLPATSLFLFPELKEKNNFHKSADFYDCENNICSDETHTSAFGLIVCVFPCRMHHATNHMKQGLCIVM